MKPVKISYGRTIPLGSFNSERLEVEVEISEGEHPEDAFKYAKEIIDKIHKENNPHLHGVQQTIKVPTEIPNIHVQPEEQPKVILTPAQKKEKQLQETKIAISTVTDIKVLESYKLIAKTNPELQEEYNKKEKELNQNLN